jgi:hypothetical protein
VEVRCDMIREPHTLQCRVVTHTKGKLTCIQQVVHVKVPLDYSLDNFLESFACCGQEAYRSQILWEFWIITWLW